MRLRRSRGVVLAVVAATLLVAGAGEARPAAAPAPSLRIATSAQRLEADLRSHGVELGRGRARPGTLASAWRAFEQFARLRVARGQLSRDPMADALLFEVGVYDFGDAWGRTLQIDFVRQFGLPNGNLQQVHLVAHFPARTFPRLLRRIAVRRCARGTSCAFSCTDGDPMDLLGTPCALARGTPTAETRRLVSADLWSYDAGGATPAAERLGWLRLVARSAVLRAALAAGPPLGFQVWRDSAD